MKVTLIVLAIVAIALFTGTWVFGGLEILFGWLESACSFLKRIFDLFGWSKGVL